MFKRYHIEKQNDETYLRIWQKVEFGKQILEPGFFENRQIPDTEDSHKLNVFQFDGNTRVFYLDNYLYFISSDEGIYNYLDTGRVFSIKGGRTYYRNNNLVSYIYNDMLITDKQIKNFERYEDKENLSFKLLGKIDLLEIYLIFNEDLDKIKNRLAEIEVEGKELENKEKTTEELKDIQERERFKALVNQYDKMTLLEDNDTIIKDNYFIDKNKGLKIEFKDKVVKLFDKDDLVSEDNYNNKFIQLDYRSFLQKLEGVYRVGKYETPIDKKLTENCNKKWLNFKIYSYDKETKVETFLKEIKIENNHNDKGKLRFKINDVKMPIQKMNKAIEFIGGGYYNNIDETVLRERIQNLENYLEKIRLFSGTQLELLSGKTIEIRLDGTTIPIHFNIKAEDKDHWEISIDNFRVKRDYKSVKDSFKYLSGGGLTAIGSICDTLQAGAELEDILIDKIKGFVEKRRLAEARAEQLFNEFLEKNKTRVFIREGGYVVKGKLKNYIVKRKNDNDVGVWTFPGNDYICINEKTKEGSYLCKYDKLLQFCMVMMNDGNLREEISTIH